jgi:hypothetical protein
MATTTSGIGQFNFTLKQSADTTITATWLDDTGNAMNLTGFSMALTIRAFVSSPIAVLSLTSSAVSGSRIVLGGTSGTISIIFTHTDTADLPATGATASGSFGGFPSYPLGVYDLQYTDPSGNVGYLLEGSVSLDPRVT